MVILKNYRIWLKRGLRDRLVLDTIPLVAGSLELTVVELKTNVT